jgi:hypothetical protein
MRQEKEASSRSSWWANIRLSVGDRIATPLLGAKLNLLPARDVTGPFASLPETTVFVVGYALTVVPLRRHPANSPVAIDTSLVCLFKGLPLGERGIRPRISCGTRALAGGRSVTAHQASNEEPINA